MTPHPHQQTPYTLPATLTPERSQELYQEIVHLYDLVERVLMAVQGENVINRNIQLELATPFVTQVTNSANILSAFYNEVVNKKLPITPDLQDTMESAFRNIFYAYKEFVDGAEAKLLPKEE